MNGMKLGKATKQFVVSMVFSEICVVSMMNLVSVLFGPVSLQGREPNLCGFIKKNFRAG